MDLGSVFSSIFVSLMHILSLRISFTWFGKYFSFSIMQVFLGILITSLAIVLFYKIINKES